MDRWRLEMGGCENQAVFNENIRLAKVVAGYWSSNHPSLTVVGRSRYNSELVLEIDVRNGYAGKVPWSRVYFNNNCENLLLAPHGGIEIML